jgi:Tol biopolymer transport system component
MKQVNKREDVMMNPKRSEFRFLVLIPVLLLVLLSYVVSQQTAAELFEKALYLEEAQGDLQSAIDLYKEILKQFPHVREIAAKAQLHLGLCFEKLGLQKAQMAFQKVVEDYPDQKEVVKIARDRLSRIERTRIKAEGGDRDFTIRKVWSGPEAAGMGSISPDGRFLTFVDWDTGDLGILELATGKKRHLTNKGSWLESQAMAFKSVWSPDGKQIVFDWWDWSEPVFVGLRAVEPDGSNLRDLYRLGKPYDRVTIVQKWLSNGEDILLLIGGQERDIRIVLLSKQNRTERTLKTLDSSRVLYNEFVHMDCSPDVNHLVYDFPPEDSVNRDIYTLSIDREQETPLIEHPADDVLLGWASDGKSILFTSDRRGSLDLWTAPVVEGKLKGAPEMIVKGVGEIWPLGFSNDGSFYYVSSWGAHNVYTAQLDPETGKVLERPKNPIVHMGKSTHSPSYSPDGKYLAYISDREAIRDFCFALVIRDLETGEEREIYPGYDFQFLRWSPDSQSILALASDKPDRTGREFLCLIDITDGKLSPVMKCELDRYTQWISSADWTQDGKSVYYVLIDKPRNFCKLLVRDLKNREEREIYRSPNVLTRLTISRSPDGQWLALISYGGSGENKRNLRILPASGGEPRELLSFKEYDSRRTQAAWTADGKHILFVRSGQEGVPRVGDKSDLWRIPVGGGKPEKINLTMSRLMELTVHPEGNHIAFTSYGPSRKSPELWVMENILPKKNIR